MNPPPRSEAWHFAQSLHKNLVGYDDLVQLMKIGEASSPANTRLVLPLHKTPRTQLILTQTRSHTMDLWQIEINIKLYGKGDMIYYGAIDSEGVLRPSSALRQTDLAEKRVVWYVLQKLRISPAALLATYGKSTGVCCFCNRMLTDEKSIKVGYGPICAKKFGLNQKATFDLNQFM